VRELAADGADVVAFDVGEQAPRLSLIATPGELARVVGVRGDVTELAALERAIDEHGITSVIHLAALQIPACRANPPLGASVNVLGTVNVLEAVRRRRDAMRPVVYASSIAAADALETPAGAVVPPEGVPSTLYGVYKRATEGAARSYWAEAGVASIGLRPHTVYGPGRDQGLTSAPTTAMLAAAAGVPYRIGFGGRCLFHHARDVARMFIAASRSPFAGAAVVNLPGHVASVADVVAAIERAEPSAAGLVSADGAPLPFPAEADPSGFAEVVGAVEQPSLEAGVAATVDAFRGLLERGLVLAPPPSEIPTDTLRRS